MVKTLLKHEFMGLGRFLTPMYIILVALAVITRVIAFFETDGLIYDIVLGSSIAVLLIAMMVALIYTIVCCVIRFYKNLFSKEGYLTFTLPVSATGHLLTKLFTAVVYYLATCTLIFVCFCIAASGDLLIEIIKAAGYILGKAAHTLGANLGLYFAELALYMLVAICSGMLLFYACMCIGQLARKNRILLALGIYFGYYYIIQIIVTIFIMYLASIENTPAFLNILDWVALNPIVAIHSWILGLTAVNVVMGGVYYLIAHTIIKKKLNLE